MDGWIVVHSAGSTPLYVPDKTNQPINPTLNTGKPEPISMTAPVQMSGHKMQFVMPAKYINLDQLPVPTNPAVHLKYVPWLCGCRPECS